MAGMKILFTGDSITDGNRYKKKSQEWDLNHQMGHSYAYIVNGILGSKYPQKQFVFKNRGVSGNRIIDLYARVETDLFPLNPDVLSILVGVNDGPIDKNNYEPTKQDKYDVIYRMMLDDIKDKLPDCKIVLMEPFVCNAGRLREENEYNLWRECVESYASSVKKISQDYDTVFVPLQDKFDEKCQEYNDEYWSWDGIHPTENGHGLIAQEWIKATKELLGL